MIVRLVCGVALVIALMSVSASTAPQALPSVERLIVAADQTMKLAKNPPGRWKPIETTSRAIYLLDQGSIRRGTRGAEVIVFEATHPPPYDVHDLKIYYFDCQGRLSVDFGSYASTVMVTAAAVEIEAIACSR
jgi:hypothetical protein